jgi:hypothetical protein
MATAPDPRSGAEDDFGVLVGWSHAPFSRGIQLKVQSTSGDKHDRRPIDARNYLMTRNQALILAKYLLDVTGQTLPSAPREGRVKRLLRRLTGG